MNLSYAHLYSGRLDNRAQSSDAMKISCGSEAIPCHREARIWYKIRKDSRNNRGRKGVSTERRSRKSKSSGLSESD